MPRPFDSVLVVAFGGPEGPDEVRPFLANVLRGRRVPPDRVEAVARHYEIFGGVSPLNAITRRQAEGLRARLAERGVPLPVYLGMRNWHPLLPDTVKTMSQDGASQAIGFICAAHRSYSSCTQYKQNVVDARGEAARDGLRDVSVTYVSDWHTHPKFVAANAGRVREAAGFLDDELRGAARLVFTAHSIPESMTGAARYKAQLLETSVMVAAKAGMSDWTLVFQSRSGRPEDPWLGPDISDYLRDAHASGLRAAVVCPIGFLCDHIEVLYDLDHEAAEVSREIGLPMVRAQSVNDDPLFLDMMADVVIDTWRQYERGQPLPVAPQSAPERAEGPPVSRGSR